MSASYHEILSPIKQLKMAPFKLLLDFSQNAQTIKNHSTQIKARPIQRHYIEPSKQTMFYTKHVSRNCFQILAKPKFKSLGIKAEAKLSSHSARTFNLIKRALQSTPLNLQVSLNPQVTQLRRRTNHRVKASARYNYAEPSWAGLS
jgi:hypothetical protein